MSAYHPLIHSLCLSQHCLRLATVCHSTAYVWLLSVTALLTSGCCLPQHCLLTGILVLIFQCVCMKVSVSLYRSADLLNIVYQRKRRECATSRSTHVHARRHAASNVDVGSSLRLCFFFFFMFMSHRGLHVFWQQRGVRLDSCCCG